MGSTWSSSSSGELPRNENGKRLRPVEASSETDRDSSYRVAIMEPSRHHPVYIVREEEQEEPVRRTKRQRVRDYTPSSNRTIIRKTTYYVTRASPSPPVRTGSTLPFLASTMYNLTGRLLVLVAQTYLSVTEYVVKNTSDQTEEICQAVSDMLDDFQSMEPDVLTRGWRILCACSLVGASPTRASGIRDAPIEKLPENDVGVVITGMKLHSSSLRLQLLGCRALKILLDSGKATWGQLAEEGFVRVMMDAMKQFPKDLVLQGLMMSFLGMILKENNDNSHRDNNDDDDEESIPRKLMELGVVEVILAALTEFEEYSRLLHTGCLALLQIAALLEEARERIVANNGHILIYRIMKEHLRDELLLMVSLNTLSKLLSVQRIDGLPLDDAVQTVLECMDLYPEEESVQTHALVSILRLGEHTQVPAETTIQKMIPAMTLFRHSRSFTFIACVVIRSLIANSTQPATVLQLLLDTGGIECIVNAARDHESRCGIQQIVKLLLSVLLVHQHATGVPSVFRGSLRVVGQMTNFEDFDSDNEDE